MKRIIIFVVALAIIVLPRFTAKADINPKVLENAALKAVKTLNLRVTAYTSSPDETDDTPFTTALGTEVHDGVVATNLLPFGTKVKIPSLFGDKIFTVEDRMNKRMKNAIDIWMTEKTAALRFGVSYAKIVVLGNVTSSAISESNAPGNTL